MRDPIDMIATASAFVESSSTVSGAQVFDHHDAIPDPTPHEILLLPEILYGLSPFDTGISAPPTASPVSRPSSMNMALVRKLMSMPKKLWRLWMRINYHVREPPNARLKHL